MSRQSIGKLKPESCALLVCDVQERFTSLITGFNVVVDTCRRMVIVVRTPTICFHLVLLYECGVKSPCFAASVHDLAVFRLLVQVL